MNPYTTIFKLESLLLSLSLFLPRSLGDRIGNWIGNRRIRRIAKV